MLKKIILSLLLISYLLGKSNYNTAIDYYNNGDYKMALGYFLKAANQNNSEAQYILGYFYTGGIGTKQDLTQSLKWYQKAAKNGHLNAKINLGFMYIAGQGTKVDYTKAAYWIKQAKDKGSKKADVLWKEFKLQKYYKNEL